MSVTAVNFTTECINDTVLLGEILADVLPKGSVLALVGDLAAGKTFLASALFKKRGFTKGFSSPSFSIINEYTSDDDNKENAYHIDVYRIQDNEELLYIGFEDCFKDSDIVVIEWADMIYDILPENTFWVKIESCSNPFARFFTISGSDQNLLIKIKEKTDACFGC